MRRTFFSFLFLLTSFPAVAADWLLEIVPSKGALPIKTIKLGGPESFCARLTNKTNHPLILWRHHEPAYFNLTFQVSRPNGPVFELLRTEMDDCPEVEFKRDTITIMPGESYTWPTLDSSFGPIPKNLENGEKVKLVAVYTNKPMHEADAPKDVTDPTKLSEQDRSALKAQEQLNAIWSGTVVSRPYEVQLYNSVGKATN